MPRNKAHMEAERGTFYRYRLFGLRLRSTIALPELASCVGDDPADVEIALGTAQHFPHGDPEALVATADGVVLAVANVARFRICKGQTILVEPTPTASERNVRLFLLGSAMGILLHQRRILPLHANAVDLDGGAVAFMGMSGAGKSTLAAAFHDRGRSILSDDVCAVIADGNGFIAQPGIPRLRLWRDAVERSGRNLDDCERAFDALDKYTVGIGCDSRSAALPLRAIYLLSRHNDRAPEISPLSGLDAVEALVENTYRGRYVACFGDPQAHFATCLAISRTVPVFKLSRPWDTGVMGATIGRIEDHLGSMEGRSS
ncbi:hypothetical protein MZO42_13695 [Sphingomonas psychrotolerans]|uniref:HPr kinase/phosphorylase C-terminal domain-containing protein n=1 Tax=Sphingomonas psychrotolerans TaxID=1327635 RepID=A0ABU3N8D1_9SPHN|nr:hypothetical protein [Sphingomonas psychrotolerans]